jgi:glycosyltransferase involved in cell wall biosynthesis
MSLCDEMERSGHEIAIICARKGVIRQKPASNRPVYHLPELNNVQANGNDVAKELTDVVKKIRPDLIQVHNMKNPFALEVLHDLRPTLKFIHTHYPVCLGAKYHRWWKKVCSRRLSILCPLFGCISHCCTLKSHVSLKNLKIAMRELNVIKRLDRLLVASSYMKRILVQNGINPIKIEVIPYYVNLPNFTYDSTNKDGNIILFVGRLTFEKGVQYLIRSLVDIKLSYKVIIIGEGRELPALKSLAEKLGLAGKVEFKGWITPDRLEGYFRKAAFLVMTSVWPEPFGCVGIEAMSYGKPVIAFDVGGVREWMKDGYTGFLVRNGDVDGLSLKMNYLLENRALARKMGNAARKWTEERFVKQHHLNRLIAIYREILSKQEAN